MWFPDVARHLAAAGAQMLIVPNGSPYEIGKQAQRLRHATARARETGLGLLYVNQVGGQDELVFDGASFVIDAHGESHRIGKAFASDIVMTEWRVTDGLLSPSAVTTPPEPSELEEIYLALTLGLGDYVGKNGFPGVVLGLSGGIDSALAAALAVDALGPERVHAVMMPSPYTSRDSLEDAALCADMLGIHLDTISIEPGMEAFARILGNLPGIAGENIQSRLRGMTLMALSNRDGAMVLSTGNKSEMAVGYATLYGDMCGGFSVLKDVYKTQVFALARWRNRNHPAGGLGPAGPVMPERVITKPPSAELKPNQTDQDSLPPYDILDGILAGLIEKQGDVHGFEAAEVARVWRMLDRAEYKRRQSPPGVKITSRSFGRERRYPITNHFGPGKDD
jgi:NAD+ synthase